MALCDSDLTIVELAAQRALQSGFSRMAIRTTAVLELGGESLLSNEDKQQFASIPEHEKHLHTSQVDAVKVLALLPSSPAPAA
jgi:hypothetical protein